MKKTFILCLSAAFIAACAPSVLPTSGKPDAGTKYPSYVVSAFTAGCKKGDSSLAQNFTQTQINNFCACTINQIQENVKLVDFITHLQKYSNSMHGKEPYKGISKYCVLKNLL